MNPHLCISLILALASSATAAADAPPSAQAPAMTALECAVWAREASFAASVAAHDAQAFRAHLHPDAVFIDGRGNATRGADAVAESWSAIVEGQQIILGWHPSVVVIAGDPAVALSRGPYWMELPQADGPPKYMTGQFISTWVRNAKGEWQVLFDGGGGNQPQPSSAEEIEALKASLDQTCPST
ncbi:MAG: nuclear transport factor 2 family protein [Xanthomonadales bacterium]|nr:nuclear transport factor 2 family protein [Xanthomonadales bacterium]MCP5473418.1 nuclear transport factor 2 family protein [Rhodanobacteraceae bacterium]